MLVKFSLIIFLFLSPSISVGEEETVVTKKNVASLQTNISFEDAFVNAKHHGLGEAVVTVGADKVLDSLLGVKKDFKKRIKKNFYKF